MINPDVRRVLDGTSIAHLATVLTGPGSQKARNLRRDPHVALSLTLAYNPFEPVVIRGRVVEWLEGDAALEVVDRIAMKYLGTPYPREIDRAWA